MNNKFRQKKKIQKQTNKQRQQQKQKNITILSSKTSHKTKLFREFDRE